MQADPQQSSGGSEDVAALRCQIEALTIENALLRRSSSAHSASGSDPSGTYDASEAQAASQHTLQENYSTLALLSETGAALAAELDLDRLVQIVTDAGTKLVGAQFGAFFYNTTDARGDSYMLYSLSGVERAAFERFPTPRRTEIFGPTFDGLGIIRSADITQDPRYGHNAPYNGMPKGHLPVRSYLAVPVISRSGEVLGGLFFGHSKPNVFNRRAEDLVRGIAGHAAIAVDNARLLQAVRHSEDRFRALIEHSADAIEVIDNDGRIRYASPAVLSIEGRTVEELVGHQALEHCHPDEVASIAEAVRRIEETDCASVQLIWRRRHKNGHWVWIEGTITNLRNDTTIRGTVVNYRDITARRRIEEVQAHSQKLEALGTLAGGIAHDFNNILLAISGNTRLAIADLPRGHQSRESLQEVAKASQRAIALVNQILTFSRHQETAREAVELQPIVAEALQLLRATVPATIDIRSEFAAEAQHAIADSSQIHQVVMNLVTNAAHAIGNATGVIAIAIESQTVTQQMAETIQGLQEGTYACIVVSDTGCGMDRATSDRIFDPFFTTKAAGQGTGLGLSVVHGIMCSHEGAISVQSQPGHGTTFRLYFPVASAIAEPEVTVQAVDGADAGRGEHVLYVDDDEAIVFLTSRVLERLGYRVSGFTSAAQALAAFDRAPREFDVVVTDLSMPGMSGFELVAALRAIRPDIAVRMTSGYIRSEDNEAAQARGIPDIILKPNSVEELGKTLHRLFSDRRSASP